MQALLLKAVRSSLVEAQQADSELKGLSQTACSETEAGKVLECYYVKDGILMRKWRPPLRPADEDWTVVHQVVPPCYRNEILRIAKACLEWRGCGNGHTLSRQPGGCLERVR